MKINLLLVLSVVVLLTMNSCFKDEPKGEMRRAAGSWRIEHVTIQQNDSLGNEVSTSEISEPVGMLLLTHDDEFMFEGRYSYSYDGAALASSSMNALFVACDTWGLGVEGKTFNLGNNDGSTGYTTHVAGFTVLKLHRKKMELQYVRVHPQTGYLYYVETWKLVRAAHL
jgi:hypothetical protein